MIAEYRAKIAALEHKVGRLTLELDLLKKTPSPRLAINSASACIINGPPASPSVRGAKYRPSAQQLLLSTGARIESPT